MESLSVSNVENFILEGVFYVDRSGAFDLDNKPSRT